MAEIEKIIEETGMVKGHYVSSLAKAIEQYVIKARLNEDEIYETLLKIYRKGTFPSLGRLRAFAKAVDKAQLKKGVSD